MTQSDVNETEATEHIMPSLSTTRTWPASSTLVRRIPCWWADPRARFWRQTTFCERRGWRAASSAGLPPPRLDEKLVDHQCRGIGQMFQERVSVSLHRSLIHQPTCEDARTNGVEQREEMRPAVLAGVGQIGVDLRLRRLLRVAGPVAVGR